MVDTVINGTRQSRSILGNADIPLEWPEALAMLKSTGWKIDLGPLNAAGLTTKGTDLNKANLFSDVAAANFGLGANGTPDQAFRRLTPIETGSYTGYYNGATSEATAKSLTFQAVPNLLIIVHKNNQAVSSAPLPIGVFTPKDLSGTFKPNGYNIIPAPYGFSSSEFVHMLLLSDSIPRPFGPPPFQRGLTGMLS